MHVVPRMNGVHDFMLPTWICSCQSVGTVNFILPFTTNVTISISILQTFRSWVATSHLRPPMAFLSHNLSDTPGLAPCSDKRDDFNFHITNFPFLSSNIPSSPAFGVFISQLIRYARACSSYECFILRAMRLSNKLLGQGYVKERLKSSLRKFYGRYGDLTKQYEVPFSRMLHDILDDDHIQWHPPLIGHTPTFDHYWSRPYYRIWLFT